MADEQPPSAPRGRRRPPTIEGEATEIGGTAGAPASGTASASGPASGSESQFASAGAASAEPGGTPSGAHSGARSGRFQPRSYLPGWLFSGPSGWRRPVLPAGSALLLSAGLVGAAAAVIVLLIAGALSGRDERTAVLQTRVARLEQQLKELSDRAPATANAIGADTKRLDDLAARLGKLETAPPRPPVADPALAGRVAASERELKSLTDDLAALRRRTDEMASASATAAPPAAAPDNRAEIDAAIASLATRVAALERSEKSTAAAVAERPTTQADPAARLAFAAEALNSAVERGAPYAAELRTAKSLAPDAGVLAPLEPFAASGVPRAQVLAQELSALVPALTDAAGAAPTNDTFLGKLQAHAEKLVRIRPLEETPGDDPATVLARIDIKAARNDLPGALAEIEKLPPPARAKATAWADKAKARVAAIESSRRFAAAALAGLSK